MKFTCFFSHGHTRRERDEDGRLALRCERCGHLHVLFQAAPLTEGSKRRKIMALSLAEGVNDTALVQVIDKIGSE